MVYVWSPILIGDNKRKYSSQQPWIHGTSLMRALHVWSCVTDFSSLTALLGYLVTCKIRAHSPSPDGRYQIICNFVRTCYEPLAYAKLIFDRCVAARLCQQTRYIVPVESAGANRVPIVPEDSGSHRHRDYRTVFARWAIQPPTDPTDTNTPEPTSQLCSHSNCMTICLLQNLRWWLRECWTGNFYSGKRTLSLIWWVWKLL